MELKIPATMTVQEFLAWDAPPGPRWQLVDGEPQAMAPGNRSHGRIQARLISLIDTHLIALGGQCTVIDAPGVVPRVRADKNFRIPDRAVICTGYEHEEAMLTDPVLLVEVLSPRNQAETWTNVWGCTIPSVREILIVYSTAIRADLLRRDAAGDWPDRPLTIETGLLQLSSIDFSFDLTAFYQGTRLIG